MNRQSTMEHISRELCLSLAYIDVYNFDEMDIRTTKIQKNSLFIPTYRAWKTAHVFCTSALQIFES